MFASFDSFEIEMSLVQAESVSHSGRCDADVAELLSVPEIQEQLSNITDTQMIAVLKEYGAWSDEELQNRSDNNARIIWIAGCGIVEEFNEHINGGDE